MERRSMRRGGEGEGEQVEEETYKKENRRERR